MATCIWKNLLSTELKPCFYFSWYNPWDSSAQYKVCFLFGLFFAQFWWTRVIFYMGPLIYLLLYTNRSFEGSRINLGYKQERFTTHILKYTLLLSANIIIGSQKVELQHEIVKMRYFGTCRKHNSVLLNQLSFNNHIFNLCNPLLIIIRLLQSDFDVFKTILKTIQVKMSHAMSVIFQICEIRKRKLWNIFL